MARQLKNSNPFLDDDDDVDDFEFLNPPKQDYMLGNAESKLRNECEVKRRLQEKRCIEERTLQSTISSLGLLHESEQVGILTAEELLKQREQLENIEENLDTINNTMKTSQKHINSLKGIFGGIKNFFSKGTSLDPALKPPNETQIISSRSNNLYDRVGELRTDTKLSEDTHPALRIRDLPSSGSTRFPNDIDGKIEQNLDHLCTGLGRLKNLAIDLHDEIDQQNDMIDTIHNKADKADETLEYQNSQIKRILKK